MQKTALKFYEKTLKYEKGTGKISEFKEISTSFLGENINIFYCDWKYVWGQQLIAAESQGVKNMATIKMSYNPMIFQALYEKEVLIVKNADTEAVKLGQPNYQNQNLYIIFGSVDNINEVNKEMEFKVRRLEKK